MKKIFLFLFMSLFIFPLNSFATVENNSYVTVGDEKLNFSATLKDGVVRMYWDKFTRAGDYGFSYYKIIRSSTKTNPYYPEDGYISYTTDINDLSYVDSIPLDGKSYYRVCAIAFNKGNYRFCSNVVVINNSSSTQPTSQQIGVTNDSGEYVFSLSMKVKMNNAVKAYIKKIEAKTTNVNKRIEIVDAIINKLYGLKTNEVQNHIVVYLIDKFEEYKTSIKDDFNEIDNVINDLIK